MTWPVNPRPDKSCLGVQTNSANDLAPHLSPGKQSKQSKVHRSSSKTLQICSSTIDTLNCSNGTEARHCTAASRIWISLILIYFFKSVCSACIACIWMFSGFLQLSILVGSAYEGSQITILHLGGKAMVWRCMKTLTGLVATCPREKIGKHSF